MTRDRNFPPEIALFASRPGVKAWFVSDMQPSVPNDCPNCGGSGVFALFCAIRGPFQQPGAPYQIDPISKQSLSSHFDATIGKHGAWWVGHTYTFPCPECQNLAGQNQRFVQEELDEAFKDPTTREGVRTVTGRLDGR